jgi:hypothetical protein
MRAAQTVADGVTTLAANGIAKQLQMEMTTINLGVAPGA